MKYPTRNLYFLAIHSHLIARVKTTNNEQKISIPHKAAECSIENCEFIVSEREQVNPDHSRAMSALTFLLFKYTAKKKARQTLSQLKPRCNDRGVLNLHHDNDVKEVVSSQPSVTWCKSTNQKIGIP